MDPLIIEAALNGGTSKARNPHTPKSPDEIAADAFACLDAGATVIHTHLEGLRQTGDEAAQAGVLGEQHGPHAARAQFPNDPIGADLRPDHRLTSDAPFCGSAGSIAAAIPAVNAGPHASQDGWNARPTPWPWAAEAPRRRPAPPRAPCRPRRPTGR